MRWYLPKLGGWRKPPHLWIFASLWVFVVVLLAIVAGRLLLFAFLPWGSPQFEYDLRLPSPDGRYDVVVVREDRSATDDFYYHVFIFPSSAEPKMLAARTSIRFSGIWTDERYLIYAGYAVPGLRWTSPHEVTIDIDDLFPQISEFHPIPGFNNPKDDFSKAVYASLLMNRSDPRDLLP